MSISRFAAVLIGSLALAHFAGAAPVFGQSNQQASHVLVPAEKVQWAPAPPALPPGAQISVLEGNPAESGPVTLRLKFPAQYTIPPHWHSMAERLTVLSGALNVGMGDKVDRPGSQTLQPGGFVSLPANMHHYAWTTNPTVVQISLQGPFDIFYVNPTDDPQRRSSSR